MACGTPVIAVPMGSVPELVVNGETGFWADNVEEICALLPKVETLDRARCRQWVEEEFNVNRMVDGYLDVYRRVLADWANR